jgi:hypothetical protein
MVANKTIEWALGGFAERLRSLHGDWTTTADSAHPLAGLKVFGAKWAEQKHILLLPFSYSPARPSKTNTTPGAPARPQRASSFWGRPALRDYNARAKLLAHAKEYGFKTWAAAIDAFDAKKGNIYGAHRHQRRCFLKHGFKDNRCLGPTQCSRCACKQAWDAGIKAEP